MEKKENEVAKATIDTYAKEPYFAEGGVRVYTFGTIMHIPITVGDVNEEELENDAEYIKLKELYEAFKNS